jgi:hypothetical protein
VHARKRAVESFEKRDKDVKKEKSKEKNVYGKERKKNGKLKKKYICVYERMKESD